MKKLKSTKHVHVAVSCGICDRIFRGDESLVSKQYHMHNRVNHPDRNDQTVAPFTEIAAAAAAEIMAEGKAKPGLITERTTKNVPGITDGAVVKLRPK